MSAGAGLRVFTDEMIRPRLAAELRGRGYDVLSCRAAGRVNQSISDEDQLAFATIQRRALYTFNAGDFDDLRRQWAASGRSHAGIIVSVDLNADLPEMVRRLERHVNSVDPSQQHNRLMILCP